MQKIWDTLMYWSALYITSFDFYIFISNIYIFISNIHIYLKKQYCTILWPVFNVNCIIVSFSLKLCFKRGWDFSPFDYI